MSTSASVDSTSTTTSTRRSTSTLTTTTSPSLTTFSGSKITTFLEGPIITTFTPPTSCQSTLTMGSGDGGYLYVGYQYSSGYYDPSCMPMGASGLAQNIQTVAGDMYYYSPAQCPTGWTSQLVGKTYNVLSTALVFDSDHTVALCCPTGFTSMKDFYHSCAKEVFGISRTTYLYKIPSSIGGGVWLSTAPEVPLTTILGGGDAAVTIYAAGYIAVWKSTDMSKFVAGPSQTTTTSIAPTNTPTASAIPQSSEGLSTGAKIGIGLGVPAFVLLLALIGFFIYHRRGRKQAPAELDNSTGHYDQGKDTHAHRLSEMPGQPMQGPVYYSASPDPNQLHHQISGQPGGYIPVPGHDTYKYVQQQPQEMASGSPQALTHELPHELPNEIPRS